MNCQDCSDQLVPFVEHLLDDAAAEAMKEHLARCANCRAEANATRQLRGRLLAAADTPIGAGLSQAVMDQILVRQVEVTRRLKMRRRLQVFGMSGIAAALLIGITWVALEYGPSPATAQEVIARGVQAATNLKSIYLKCRVRTLPGDNFESLDVKRDLIDVELWKDFGPPLRWRIEKPGRVVVMNGQNTVMLMGNKVGVKLDVAAPSAFDTEWLHRLAAIDGVLSQELASTSIPSHQSKISRVERPDDATHEMVVVQVEMNDNVGAYLKNKSLETSDTRREYLFDRKTGRLENAKFYCQSDEGKDVLVLEIVQIDYDPAIDPGKFELEIPKDVVWFQQPQRLPDNEKYDKMTPSEAAHDFFAACGSRDWGKAEKFWQMPLTDEVKQYLGGLEMIKLGEPFQAKPYGGWFVPYEIKMSNGEVRKHNLALRNDNPAKRYVVDGGL
jgi:outer membrane lipoprotein-sorting protein